MPAIKLNKLISTTSLYDEAARRCQELTKIKHEREQALKKAPSGKIHVIKARTKPQFYVRAASTDKSGKYIPKSEIGAIKAYLQKAYNEKLLKIIDDELQVLRRLLGGPSSFANSIRMLYSDNPPEIKQLLIPADISDEEYADMWMSIPYEGKEISEQLPYYETKRKERVRSKSELNIANTLDAFNLPYKYECPLTLVNGKTIYPDFTVLHIARRKLYYWEHRGMMDDREYASQAVFKVKQLRKSGIVLGENLILTEETIANPLGSDEIKDIIKQYFS